MTPLFRKVADRAVLVELGDLPDPLVEVRVQALDRALVAARFPGFAESVPAFVNLLVVFDPLLTDHDLVIAHLTALLDRASGPPAPPRLHQVDICYAADFATDMPDVARQTGLTPAQVIAAHLAAEFHLVMYGFAPGYAYLGGLPPALHLDRKPKPVRDVPAGSVIIAGGQCIVTTLTMPTGWWVIGRSPTPILTPNAARPFLFDVGDRVRFRPVADLQ